MAKTIITLVLRAKDEVSNILKSTAAKVTALIAAFGGAAAIKNTVNNLSELDQMARRLNVSMEDLTAAQYAAFSGAGVQPDAFVDAIDDMRIKIEEFRSLGSGGAADFFEVLNEDVNEFARLNPLEQLEKIAKAMDGLEDTQAFTFLDQMGSDNLRNLAPLLRNGGKEFEALKQKAKDLGLTLSDEETIGINALSTSFGNLTSIISRTFDKIVAGFGPELTAFFDTIADRLGGMGEGASKSGNIIGNAFSFIVDMGANVYGAFARVISAFHAFRYTGATAILSVVEVILRLQNTILQFLNKFSSTINSLVSKIVSGVVTVIDKGLLAPLESIASKIPGIGKGVADALNKARQGARGIGDSITESFDFNKGVENHSKALDEIIRQRKQAEESMMRNVRQIIDNDDHAAARKFNHEYKMNRLKIAEETEDEVAKRRANNEEKTLRELQEKNAKAAADILSARAKLASDIAKIEINEAMSAIDTRAAVEMSGLEARARAESWSTKKLADERMRIELDAARQISAQRKKLVDEDIKVLQAQVEAQRKIMSVEAKSGERELIAAEIVKLESEIALKMREQKTIGAELINQQAIIQAARAAENDQLLEQLDDIRESAEIELKLLRGDIVSAELDELEREFRDTIRDLEALGEDSTAVQNLINARKAKIEMDEIERKFAELKRKLQDNKIKPGDYLEEVNKLENRGMELADITGNQSDRDKIKDAAEEARGEVFSLEKTMEEITDSMSDKLSNVFVDFITGTKSAKEAFSDFANSMLQEITKIIAKLMAQYAVQSMLAGLGMGSASAGGGGFFGRLFTNHSGGLLGESGISRSGSIGLRSDEALIIGRKGEEVLTETHPRHIKNAGKGNKGGNSGGNIVVNNMIDSPSIAKAMEGSDGERVIMNVIRANRGEIKSL